LSRLDSAIRRLEAQRACLDLAAEAVREMAGPVLELGLGNGRTYDHLRERLPGRDIWVFERKVAAHPDCMPPADRLILGDLAATLPATLARLAPPALVHFDIGQGEPARDAALGRWLGALLAPALARGGILVGDQDPGEAAELVPLDPPPGVAAGRYFLRRRE
jgi:hypothetical protein